MVRSADEARVRASSPYQGLIPYEEGDAHFFFGREQETQVIIANLFASSLTLLYGASGVGKSSILRAGVTHNLSQREDLLVVVFSTWQSNPLVDLKAAVARAASAKRVNGNAANPAASDPAAKALLVQAETLLDYVRAWSSILDCSLLIILDQFEEYFLYHPQGDAFEIEFAQAVSRANVPVGFLISIREDSLAKLDRFEKGIPAIFNNYLRLDHLDREAARAAIVKPLANYNKLHADLGVQKIEIEPLLVEEVLNQVKMGKVLLGEAGRGGRNLSEAEGRIETPFLQMVMTRLWNEEVKSGSNLLRLETLKQLGNAEHIIRTHLDDAMSDLTADEQEIAANVFHYLVTPTGSKIAHSARTLFHYTGLPQAQIQPVLNKLCAGDARILQPVAPAADPQAAPNYEIYHDVLAAAILDWRRRFMQVQDWSKHREDMGLEQRRVTQRRVALIALLVLIGTLIASLVVTYRARTDATKALSRELAAVASNNASNDAELNVLLAIEAVKMDPNDEAVKSLRKSLTEYPLLSIMKTKYVVRYASFSPDGRLVLTGGGEQTARLWDAATGKQVKALVGHPGQLSTAIFSPDGRLIATANTYGPTVQIWETNSDSDNALTELTGQHQGKLNEIAFSPDSKLVVTAGDDGTARIWDARTGRHLTEMNPHAGSVLSVAFSPDGSLIVTACRDGNAYVWVTNGGTQQQAITINGGIANDASFSPDGKSVVISTYNALAYVWDLELRQEKFNLQHDQSVYRASFSPDGKYILSVDGLNIIYVWDANTQRDPIAKIAPYRTGETNHPVFSPDGQLIACGAASDARVWRVTGEELKPLSGHTDFVFMTTFSPDGFKLATASQDGTARIWRVRNVSDISDLNNSQKASFSPDGRFIIAGNQLLDFATGNNLGTVGDGYDYDSSGSSSFSPDGKHILIIRNGENSHSTQIWDAHDRGFLREFPSSTFIPNAAFSGDSNRLVAMGDDHSVHVWDVNTGQLVADIKDASISYSAALSPDGAYVVTGSDEAKTPRIWDVQKQKSVRDLVGHTAPVRSVAYSHDGKWVVTGGEDSKVIVWDAQTGARKEELVADDSVGLKSVAFSPDGHLILTVGDDANLRVWDWTLPGTAPVTLEARQILNAVFSPDGMFILATRVGGVASIYSRESFLPLPNLIEMAKSRVPRELTCDEKKQYLHQRTCLW